MSNTLHRRERGYRFEKTIVDFFNKDGWQARRLGGSSTGLPDILITYNTHGMLFAVEAKSTIGKRVYIPQDQILRCIEIMNVFGYYETRRMIIATKFAKSKDNPVLKYYFFVVNTLTNVDYLTHIRVSNKGNFDLQGKSPGETFVLEYERFETLNEIKKLG